MTNAQLMELLKEELRGVKSSLSTVNNNMSQLGRELSANQQSTTGLWHAVKELGQKVDNLPGQMQTLIGDHADDCIARERARKRAIDGTSDTAIPKPQFTSANFMLPKWVLWVAVCVGASILGAGLVFGAVFFGDASAIEAINNINGRALKH